MMLLPSSKTILGVEVTPKLAQAGGAEQGKGQPQLLLLTAYQLGIIRNAHSHHIDPLRILGGQLLGECSTVGDVDEEG